MDFYLVISSPGFAISLRAIKIPGTVHHKLEVLVIFNAHGDIIVVLNELFKGDASVLGFFIILKFIKNNKKLKIIVSYKHGEVVFEVIKELSEDLIFSFLASLNIRVESSGVDASKVFDIDDSGVVLVEFLEGLLDEALSVVIHVTDDTLDEFVVVDGARTVNIEDSKEFLDIGVNEAESVVIEQFRKLIEVNGVGVVIIADFEASADTHDTSGTSGGELLTEFEEHLFALLGEVGSLALVGAQGGGVVGGFIGGAERGALVDAAISGLRATGVASLPLSS